MSKRSRPQPSDTMEHWEDIALSLDEAEACLLNGHKGRVFDAEFGEIVLPCVGAIPTPTSAVATACEDGKVRLWDLTDGSLLKTLKGHKSEAMRVAWHKLADGTSTATLASGGTEGEVFLWDVGSGGSPVMTLPHAKESQIYVCEWCPPGSKLGDKLLTGADEVMHVWDMTCGKQIAHWPFASVQGATPVGGEARNSEQKPYVFDAAISTELGGGNVLVVALGDGTVRAVDVRDSSAKECFCTPGHDKWATAVSLSHSATAVAASYGSGMCAVWDIRKAGAEWQPRSCTQVHQRPAFGCTFWPGEDNLLLSWSSDNLLKLLDVQGEEPRVLVERSFAPCSLFHCSFSSDCKTMAIAGGSDDEKKMSACLLQLSRSAESAAPAEAEADAAPAEAAEAAPKGPSAISAILGDDY